jgi:hypothetical protein
MADTLATPEDLASLLQQDLDRATATLLLECATAVIQSPAVTGQRIVQVVDDTVTLDLDGYDGGPYLPLPERPVTAVSGVSIGTTVVTDFKTQLSRGRLWRAWGWRSTLVFYPDQPSTVTVTYTHGYPTGHQRLQLARSAALSLAASPYTNPDGAVQVRIDDYAATYDAMAQRMAASPFLVGALKRQYALPPGTVQLATRQWRHPMWTSGQRA